MNREKLYNYATVFSGTFLGREDVPYFLVSMPGIVGIKGTVPTLRPQDIYTVTRSEKGREQ